MLARVSRGPRITVGRGCSRRDFLLRGLAGAGGVGLGALGAPGLLSAAHAVGPCGADSFGALQSPDANGLQLPPGFSSRVVATSNQSVGGSSYPWHSSPDGGATFATGDGGWVYVSNSETGGTSGGVGALRFDAGGNLIDAYAILAGTSTNCAGGPTPWGSWLSCEEVDDGQVYECDPFIPSQGVVRAALGTFKHEAAAVDPIHEQIYLTEDAPNGLLYRSTPNLYPQLNSGLLEAAEIEDPLGQGAIEPGQLRPLSWHAIPEPNPVGGGVQNATYLPIEGRATRYQAPAATPFAGGEGCWYRNGLVYFSTKGNNRVWCIDTMSQTIEIVYDLATTSDPELSNVDNVYVSACDDVYVSEDPGSLRIVALTPTGDVKPIVQLTGVSGTEITGPALDPSGTRLYFSSQRNPGRTYEVTGPFAPAHRVPVLAGAGRVLVVASVAAAAWLRLKLRERRANATGPDTGP